MSNSKRIMQDLCRDLYTLENPDDIKGSRVNTIFPRTTVDQIFDDKDPTQKSLRQILEDLHYEIITGGKGNINFPVTSVNGMKDDVVITKATIGLDNVDNTKDKDKPLSNPQRAAVENMLRAFDFKVDLSELYNHINDHNNPHKTTIDQIDKNNDISKMISRSITQHALSTDQSTHPDIRNSLTKLWNYTDGINNTIDDKVNNVLDEISDHYDNDLAHTTLFEAKEDKKNKVHSIDLNIELLDHTKYPSVKAVADYITLVLKDFYKYIPDLTNWVDSITVIDDKDHLPEASKTNYRKCYFIKYGNSSHDEVAICNYDDIKDNYKWDIYPLGSYSKFDETYFTDTINGLSLNVKSLINKIYNEKDFLQNSLDDTLNNYYTKEDIKKLHFIDSIKILPGTIDGTIRYQINNDITTMSEDIWVAGIKRLAFLEYITENEIANQSIYNRHIIDNAVDSRCVKDNSLNYNSLKATFKTLIGNMDDPTNGSAQEITLLRLANELRPLINNEIDPGTEIGDTWKGMLTNLVMSPNSMEPLKEYEYIDGTYGMRFTGNISAIPNYPITLVLDTNINTDNCKLVDAGGTWQYQSIPSEYTILGGSNITGHTFATINMTKNNLVFESISIGNRKDAEYDIWVKYIKN